MDAQPRPPAARGTGRDLRLDFFRGLALLIIFVDHVPRDVAAYFTLQSVAFCDAAEIFVFISGVAAALAYGRILAGRGLVAAAARIYRRVWQLYIAHIITFAFYAGLVAHLSLGLGSARFAEELDLGAFMAQPGASIGELLSLRFQPGLFIILPLYMLVLAGFPLILPIILNRPITALLPSLLLYLAERRYGWTLYLYPDQHPWRFSPLAWQFLFVIGAACGSLQMSGRAILPRGRLGSGLVAVAAAVVLACAAVSLTHLLHSIHESFPVLLPGAPWNSEIDKRDLSPVRLVNFLALAILAAALLRRDAWLLTRPLARPVILCGQHSLYIFCLSILLSATGHYVLENITDRLRMQMLVIAAGLAVMMGAATLLDRLKEATPGTKARATSAGIV